jgi:formylglycine-generating enzyme required for sulfatase activity
VSGDWLDVPGGEVLLGLTPEEVEHLVQLNVRHNEKYLEDDVDRGRWYYDRKWYEAQGGNAAELRPLLEKLCPLRKVVLRPFRMARRPVLVKDYEAFCRSTGRAYREPLHAKPDQFMYEVTWEEARAFALSAGVRLPTSAEWEWAARGPSRRLFPWGSEWLEQSDGFMHSGSWTTGWVPGSKPGLATPEGLLDMATDHGEWCSDPYTVDPELWSCISGRPAEAFRPGWGTLMGASPARLLPNGAVPFGGPSDAYRVGYAKFRLAKDA